jgi:spore maturation protein CgeB
MRVLFFESHPMLIHGLPNGFRDANCEVKISGPVTEQVIQSQIQEFQPDLVFSLGWSFDTTLINAYYIFRYTREANIPLVYWATEDPTHTISFSIPYVQILRPDFIFTISKSTVEVYEKFGFPAAHMDFGYHPEIHFQTPPEDTYTCDIAVVANAYPHILNQYPNHYRIQSLKNLIAPLLRVGIRIDFWGKDWDKMESILGTPIPPDWIHGYLSYTEANKVYSSAKIMLGLQNQLTQVSQRTYEILGSGGVLLTSDTPELRRLFQSGTDLFLSSSPEETVSLVSVILQNTALQERIRIAAKKAAQPHTYQSRAENMIRILKETNVLKG